MKAKVLTFMCKFWRSFVRTDVRWASNERVAVVFFTEDSRGLPFNVGSFTVQYIFGTPSILQC